MHPALQLSPIRCSYHPGTGSFVVGVAVNKAATVPNGGQERCGALHASYLPSSTTVTTCPPSPCGRFVCLPASLVGRDPYEYYGDFVPLGLAAGRVSRIPLA